MFKKNIIMPFVVLGDPDYNSSLKIIKTLIDNGSGALELGFAFSDPIADGKVIQKANKRALDNGITTLKAFELLKEIRDYSEIPISIMLSYNLAYQHGLDSFYKKCHDLKIDAILFPDLPLEESDEVMQYSKKYSIDQIFMVSQITSEARLEKMAKLCSGYVYLVSRLGTTGTREKLNSNLKKLIEKTKRYFNIPIYVGFGISKPEHVQKVFTIGANGVIIGSAISRIIEENHANKIKMIENLSNFLSSLKT